MEKSPLNTNCLQNLYILYFALLAATAVMGYKLVSLAPLATTPGSGLVFTFTFFLSSIITEIYGYKVMRRLIWLSVIYGAIFIVIVSLFSMLPAPRYWHAGIAYEDIFFNIAHFSVAGGIGFLISAFVNAYLIAKSKIHFKGKYFWLRSYIIVAICEIITGIFALLVSLAGTGTVEHSMIIISEEFIYKLGYGVIGMIIAVIALYLLKKIENLNIYDQHTNFNPFSFLL